MGRVYFSRPAAPLLTCIFFFFFPIRAIHVSGMEDLLLYVASSENERHLCMHILEIASLMFREQVGFGQTDKKILNHSSFTPHTPHPPPLLFIGGKEEIFSVWLLFLHFDLSLQREILLGTVSVIRSYIV